MSTKAMMGAVVALSAILASPAFAGPTDSTRNFYNDSYNAYARQYAPHARAQARHYSGRSVHGTAGQYIGSDPDPLIRSQMAKDPSQGGAVLER
jgi:hypothetical protein